MAVPVAANGADSSQSVQPMAVECRAQGERMARGAHGSRWAAGGISGHESGQID